MGGTIGVRRSDQLRGGHVLVLNLPEEQFVPVGQLGMCKLITGYYFYFGSEFNGMEGHLRRHLRSEKKSLRTSTTWLRCLE